jgi:hypothetical protein
LQGVDGPSPILLFSAMRAIKLGDEHLGIDECRFQPLSVD